MKAYRLFIHNNFGASSFTDELIGRITDTLKEMCVIGGALSDQYEIEWQGEPGEELIYHTLGFCVWPNDHLDMVAVSKKFPDCQFCLHMVADDLLDLTAYYYHNGTYCITLSDMEEPRCDIW